jgi:hypothetical protein
VADSGFVTGSDPAVLTETLCAHDDRVVNRDNTVAWGRLKLQLPESPLRHHFVKASIAEKKAEIMFVAYPEMVFRGDLRLMFTTNPH